MVGAAAGLAITGKIPFIGSFAEFVTGRVYDQIRQELAYGNTNVKIASSHAGITLGEDGATHQTMEDIALMRALPGMVVLNPCDFNQTVQATLAAAKYEGPVYLRFGRPSVPNFTDENEPFVIGKAIVMNEGKDVTLIATGHTVWEALQAAEALEAEGISAEVIDIATIKPLDEGRGTQRLRRPGRGRSRSAGRQKAHPRGIRERRRPLRPVWHAFCINGRVRPGRPAHRGGRQEGHRPQIMEELEQVFNSIVKEYSERLYWHVRRMVNSHEDADDLLQEIFLKIWTALPTFRGEAQLYTWVWRIATNETLNHLRKERVRAMLRMQSIDAEMERRIQADPFFNGTEAQRELMKGLAKLPEKQRQVFVMRWWDELSYEEISAITGTSVGALKASYHIAQEKLKLNLSNLDVSK